jgi:hypothetical protein
MRAHDEPASRHIIPSIFTANSLFRSFVSANCVSNLDPFLHLNAPTDIPTWFWHFFPLPNTPPNIANHHSTWYLVATTSSSLVQFCCPHPKCQPYACAMEPKLRHSCLNPLRHFLSDLFCSPSHAHFLFLICVLPSSAVGFPRCQIRPPVTRSFSAHSFLHRYPTPTNQILN